MLLKNYCCVIYSDIFATFKTQEHNPRCGLASYNLLYYYDGKGWTAMYEFSDIEQQQIKNHGLDINTIQQQLHDFKTGFPWADIVAPAVINNGVRPSLGDEYEKFYQTHKDSYKLVKFVPASGAATRMFKDLFEFLNTGETNKVTQFVLDNMEQFAFWDDLARRLPEKPTDSDKIRYLVTDCGLNYGYLPKALLAFHKYKNENRTALAEHLVEGAQYAGANGNVNIHFTVSPEHRDGFYNLLGQIVPLYSQRFGVKYNITMSEQKKSTDTIAVNMDNTPFRNSDGSLLFRPAGHGALIENLNDIDGDIVFIKNIDNVCPDDARDDTVAHKQRLAGLLMQIQTKIFEYLHAMDNGNADTDEIKSFVTDNLGIKINDDTNLRAILNRPLRVVGIIKNTGAPGGGPFWVRGTDGTQSLQIVEPGQIAPENQHILKNGEFFSPTDLVCGLRDYQGNKFNLNDFIDVRAGFISEKSKDGRALRAMERPGLWNGAMANWNTIFVEVPGTTFTPAKVISDLISDGHKSNL